MVKKNNIDAIYENKKIDENDLKNIFKIKKKKINGINVTVPFKKAVIPYLDKLSNRSKSNTISKYNLFKNNKTIGHNTDIDGFENCN